MSRDASKRLRELVVAGQEIPYDVEEPGSGSPLSRYVPHTERFIRDRVPALLELDSFGSGCAAIESAGLAGPYLEELGVDVPSDERRRAELAGVAFLCRLWEGSTDFSLEASRLAAAVEELEAGGEVADDEIEVVVPLRGLQLPVVRLELATATIVRADTVEVPAEARASEGGAAGWEPAFLAAARVGVGEADGEPKPDAGARAVEGFRRLITTLRLFKAGGVALGPYAWTRAGAHRWRRIATGAGRPRPGGFRLTEDELNDLVVFSRQLAYRSSPLGPGTDSRGASRALARSISRFEAGLERGAVLEALNDYLLALRFLLEGDGPARLGLSMRVAGLCAEPEHRGSTKAVIDRALSLERELWSGEPAPADEDRPTPAETAAATEGLVRAILRDAACGHLGGDLRSTADEILLADGLAVGEGGADHRGGHEEWDLSDASEVETHEQELVVDSEPDELRLDDEPGLADDGPGEIESGEGRVSEEALPGVQEGLWMDVADDWREAQEAQPDERRTGLQVPEPGGRIRIEAHPEEDNVLMQNHTTRGERANPFEADEPGQDRIVERLEGRQRTADRVAYLFPRPETTEWDVGELSYDRRRHRAHIRAG